MTQDEKKIPLKLSGRGINAGHSLLVTGPQTAECYTWPIMLSCWKQRAHAWRSPSEEIRSASRLLFIFLGGVGFLFFFFCAPHTAQRVKTWNFWRSGNCLSGRKDRGETSRCLFSCVETTWRERTRPVIKQRSFWVLNEFMECRVTVWPNNMAALNFTSPC